MKNIPIRDFETDNLIIKKPTIEEQYALWNILRDEMVNKYYKINEENKEDKNKEEKNKIEEKSKELKKYVEEYINIMNKVSLIKNKKYIFIIF